ncbi:hypothetical protein [Anditalea andensis]|uniref:Uncharacterized protein n=1 Tax=Anditalea andensis TaxID=1048983 RepID=A0A074L014_9BACT|nr:hypothetical protein [Anditalea andensis]KEO75571.1 hypothetical protein EL17_00310 [Anditalea andensis]
MKRDQKSIFSKSLMAFVVLILSFFSFSIDGFSYPNQSADHLQQTSIEQDTFTFLSNDGVNPYAKAPFLPDNCDPTPEEQEDTNENESEKDLENGWENKFLNGFSPDLFTNNIDADYLSVSLHHRKTIPFFILFHSWKSFLS